MRLFGQSYFNYICGKRLDMKRITTLIVISLAFMYANAQETRVDSARMKELMEIIELQEKINAMSGTQKSGVKWIRKGQNPYGEILYNLDGNWIRKGQNPYGEILYNIDGKWIRKGQNPYGTILYTIDGKWIRKGQNPYGEILYNIDGKWIRKGQNPYGEILYTLQ